MMLISKMDYLCTLKNSICQSYHIWNLQYTNVGNQLDFLQSFHSHSRLRTQRLKSKLKLATKHYGLEILQHENLKQPRMSHLLPHISVTTTSHNLQLSTWIYRIGSIWPFWAERWVLTIWKSQKKFQCLTKMFEGEGHGLARHHKGTEDAWATAITSPVTFGNFCWQRNQIGIYGLVLCSINASLGFRHLKVS